MPNSGKESTRKGSVKHLLIILWLCNVFISGLPPPIETKEREFEAETFIAQNETRKDFENKNKFLSAHPKQENQYLWQKIILLSCINFIGFCLINYFFIKIFYKKLLRQRLLSGITPKVEVKIDTQNLRNWDTSLNETLHEEDN